MITYEQVKNEIITPEYLMKVSLALAEFFKKLKEAGVPILGEGALEEVYHYKVLKDQCEMMEKFYNQTGMFAINIPLVLYIKPEILPPLKIEENSKAEDEKGKIDGK